MRREKLFRDNFDDILSSWDGGEAPLRDINDTHVHNAAVAGNADILLTNNVKDFPDSAQLPYDIYTPDEFFCLVNENAPGAVQEVTREQARYWNERQKANVGGSIKSLSEALIGAACPGFSVVVEQCLEFVSGSHSSSSRLKNGPRHSQASQ